MRMRMHGAAATRTPGSSHLAHGEVRGDAEHG